MENLLEQEQLMGQDLLSSDSVTYKIFRDLLDTIYVLMNVDVDARTNNTQFKKLESFYKLNNFENNSQMIANTKEFEESLLSYFGSLSHTHFKIIEDQAGSIYEEETVKISMSIHLVLSYYESKIQKQFNVAKKEDDLIIDEFVKNNSDSENNEMEELIITLKAYTSLKTLCKNPFFSSKSRLLKFIRNKKRLPSTEDIAFVHKMLYTHCQLSNTDIFDQLSSEHEEGEDDQLKATLFIKKAAEVKVDFLQSEDVAQSSFGEESKQKSIKIMVVGSISKDRK